MVRIRRFGVVRTSNVAALFYFVITLIIVIPIILFAASGPISFTDATTGQTVQINVGSPIVLLIGPFIYGALGWIFTAIFCLLYNLIGFFTGGIEVQVVRDEPPPAPQWQAPPPDWQQPPPAASPPPPSAPAG